MSSRANIVARTERQRPEMKRRTAEDWNHGVARDINLEQLEGAKYPPGSRVTYRGVLYSTRVERVGTVVTVLADAIAYPYVVQWADGWRGIAAEHELSRPYTPRAARCAEVAA